MARGTGLKLLLTTDAEKAKITDTIRTDFILAFFLDCCS